MLEIEETPKYKVVSLGETFVGKSTIIAKLTNRESICKNSTIGVCYMTHRVTVDNTEIVLEIFDTAGQERFRSLSSMYYRDAKVIFLVFSIDNVNSFNTLNFWLDELKKNDTRPIIYLVGNKSDLESDRKITREKAEKYATDNMMIYFETSGKTGDNIVPLFNDIAEKIVRCNPPLLPNNKEPDIIIKSYSNNYNNIISNCQC
jgi:small GTP-binding protein